MAKILKKVTKDVKEAGFDAFLYRDRDTNAPEPQDVEFLAKELSEITTYGVSDLNNLTGEVDLVEGEAIDLTVTAASNTITIAAEEATYTNLGVASFATADFDVTNGAVELEDTVVKTVATDSGSATPSTHEFTVAGGEGIDTSGSSATVTIAGEDASDTNKGIASFVAADFDVSSGAVSLEDTVVKTVASDSGSATPSTHEFTIAGGEGIDTSGSSATVTIAGEDASTSNKGIASFDANHFTVSSGAVSLLADGIDDTLIDWGTGANQVNAGDLPISVLGSPTWTTQQEFNNQFGGIGRVSGGTVTDAGSGNVDVAAGTGFIRVADTDTTEILSFDWSAESDVAITTDTVRHVGIEYNAGSPQVVVKSDEFDWDFDTDFPLATVVNEGDVLHILNNPWWISEGITNVIERIQADGHVVRDTHYGGLAISNPSSRYIAVTGGKLWSRLNEFDIPAIDTSVTGTVEYYYVDSAGDWYDSDVSLYSVSQWNDTTQAHPNELVALTNNWYANIWVYAEADDLEVSMLYPQAEYANVATAEAEAPPTNVPPHIAENGLLIGRLLIKEGVDAPIEIQSAFDTTFNPVQAADHGNLSGLSDDDHSQYLLAGGTRDLSGDWTVSTNSITLTAGTLTASSLTDGTATITGGGASSLTFDMASNTLTGTKAEFDTACSDGNFAYDGGAFHDGFSDFVANEHVDHSGVTLTAGTGLSGGGDITASRSFEVDMLGIEDLADPGADRILFWDDSETKTDWLTVGTGLQIAATTISTDDANIDHDSLTNFVANEHIDWTSAADNFSTSGSHTVASANGTDVNPGSDTDADLITVGVTGTPKLWWDESEDLFTLSKGLEIPSLSLASTAVTSSAAELNITDGGNTSLNVLDNGCLCRAYLGSDQNNIASGSFALIQLDTETFDIGSNFNTGTYQFTAPVTGYYDIRGNIAWKNQTANWYGLSIFVNGSEVAREFDRYVAATTLHTHITDVQYVTAGQTIDIRAYTNDGAGTADIQSGSVHTFMAIYLLSV